ncbi:MAG: hypothetical protein EB117_17885, partial [Betaproteobacteria bacterium]|nr:hypothetical protein [Betaproteobacteria bacterium]
AINESLNLEAVAASLSRYIQGLVDGFKSLNPETQGFIVKATLLVAAIGPVIFIVGKLISTYGALVGATKLIVQGIGSISKAFAYLAANPTILIITASIAALGAIALYVYDNWQAFTDRFKNIWINIKNSVMEGVANVLKNIDYLQKALGLNLFKFDGLTSYQKEQRVVAKEFKSIGETVDSLKGKLGSLFTVGAKPGGGAGGGGVSLPNKTPGGAAPVTTVGDTKIDKKLFDVTPYKTLTEIIKAKEDLNKSVVNDVAPKIREQLALTENGIVSLKQAGEDVLAFGERLKTNAPNVAKPFTDAQLALENFKGAVVDAVNAATEAFSNMAIQGETDMKKLGAAALQAARVIISAYIKEGVAGIVKNILAGPTGKALGPIALAVAGAAGAGAAVLFNTLINKVSAPKLAKGGLAFGPTMATVGDNRNARVDPEVIAPLSKLKNMLSDVGGM